MQKKAKDVRTPQKEGYEKLRVLTPFSVKMITFQMRMRTQTFRGQYGKNSAIPVREREEKTAPDQNRRNLTNPARPASRQQEHIQAF